MGHQVRRAAETTERFDRGKTVTPAQPRTATTKTGREAAQDDSILIHFSFRILGSQPAPSLTFSRLLADVLGRRQPHNVSALCIAAQAVNEIVTEECRILESLNYELVTHTSADWVCLFGARFSLSIQHLRERFPQGTGSPLSLPARVPSKVLASVDSPLSLESTPSRVGSSAWFLSCVVSFSFLLFGAR